MDQETHFLELLDLCELECGVNTENTNISCHYTPSAVEKASVMMMNLSLGHWSALGEPETELKQNHQVVLFVVNTR